MNALRVLAAAAIALGLAACNAGQDIAQIVGTAPADATPVKGAALTVPPDYDLRPPRGGGERTKAAEASRRARTTVVSAVPAGAASAAGEAAPSTTGRTAGESALLRHASSGEIVDPAVRTKVNAETDVDKDQEKAFVDKLVKYKDNDKSVDSGSGVSANPKPTIKRQGEVF